MKKEIKHNCPTKKMPNHKQHFDDKLGRCVNNEGNLEDFNSRSKSAPNLRFKKTGGD